MFERVLRCVSGCRWVRLSSVDSQTPVAGGAYKSFLAIEQLFHRFSWSFVRRDDNHSTHDLFRLRSFSSSVKFGPELYAFTCRSTYGLFHFGQHFYIWVIYWAESGPYK